MKTASRTARSAVHAVMAGAMAVAFTMGATLGSPAQAQSGAKWPVGSAQTFDKWSVSRVPEGCYLIKTGDEFANTIALASASGNELLLDSVLITDPALAPFASQALVTDSTLSFNGKAVPLLGAIVNSFPGPGGTPTAMVISMFEPVHSKAVNGKPVNVVIKAKGKTLTGTIDPGTAAVAAWRECTAEMRGS